MVVHKALKYWMFDIYVSLMMINDQLKYQLTVPGLAPDIFNNESNAKWKKTMKNN